MDSFALRPVSSNSTNYYPHNSKVAFQNQIIHPQPINSIQNIQASNAGYLPQSPHKVFSNYPSQQSNFPINNHMVNNNVVKKQIEVDS